MHGARIIGTDGIAIFKKECEKMIRDEDLQHKPPDAAVRLVRTKFIPF